MDEELRASRLRGWLSAHPIIFAVVAVCIAIGAVLGVTLLLLTGEWSLGRRIAAGAVAGAGVGLLITAPRIIG